MFRDKIPVNTQLQTPGVAPRFVCFPDLSDRPLAWANILRTESLP